MNGCDICFPGYDARSNRGMIRWELFLHRDVCDVLVTARDDTLRVIYRGASDPRGWATTLADAGFPRPTFGAGRSTQVTYGYDERRSA